MELETCNNLDESQGHSAQLENKPTSKGHILDDCIHITFSKWQCNREEKQTRVSRGKEWWRTESHNCKRAARMRYLQWWNSFAFCEGDYTTVTWDDTTYTHSTNVNFLILPFHYSYVDRNNAETEWMVHGLLFTSVSK